LKENILGRTRRDKTLYIPRKFPYLSGLLRGNASHPPPPPLPLEVENCALFCCILIDMSASRDHGELGGSLQGPLLQADKPSSCSHRRLLATYYYFKALKANRGGGSKRNRQEVQPGGPAPASSQEVQSGGPAARPSQEVQ
jgi:hypothetical protein